MERERIGKDGDVWRETAKESLSGVEISTPQTFHQSQLDVYLCLAINAYHLIVQVRNNLQHVSSYCTMATKSEIQDLLRFFTQDAKVSLQMSMSKIKDLQKASLTKLLKSLDLNVPI